MDARYHELVETTGREEGKKRSAGAEAWVLLFLSVLFVNYILLAVGLLSLDVLPGSTRLLSAGLPGRE